MSEIEVPDALAHSVASQKAETPPSEDVLMEHEYDGIQEYDNPMPGWWKSLFLVSVIFSVGYVFWFHVSGRGLSVADEYAADVARANALAAEQAVREEVSEQALSKLSADAGMMQKAGELYQAKCAQCHADQGQGNIGPNLTDNHWVHGKGTLMDIYQTVSDGVLEKGMPAWNRQLTPTELKQLVAYVGTLRGKNLQGKPPEGQEIAQP